MSESFIPPRRERKLDKAISDARTEGLAEPGRVEEAFEFVDSTLDNPGDYANFETTFAELIPPNEHHLRPYIEHTLAERKGKAVGIEFGGPGAALFEGFTPMFFNKTIGVTLAEHRKKEHIMDLETHKVLEGDLRDLATYDRVEKELRGRKADLILERLRGGWDYVERDPVMYGKVLSRWYSLLNDRGLLIAEAPGKNPDATRHPIDFGALLVAWKAEIDTHYKGQLELHVAPHLSHFGTPVFSLRKLENPPEELPLLSIRTLLG